MKDPGYNYPKVLTTENLSIGYRAKNGDKLFLQKGLHLELFKGELVCLVGPNGCGKSTLIRALSALQKPLEGSVYIEGKEINVLTNAERSELISVVLTDQSAIGNIQVDEIVSLGRYQSSNWLGSLSVSDKKKIDEAIGMVGLSGFSGRKYGTLSDGEKQRTYIAKALASDALVMLLDEPTAHLDIPNRVEIMTLLRRLTRESGHSVLVSTHDLDLAMQLADEIWLMMPGNLFFIGSPEELSISGYLDKVFGNSHLSFNPDSGTFCINANPTGEVSFDGRGANMEITRKALIRMGYLISDSTKVPKITVNENEWKLNEFDGRKVFARLSELCRYMRNKAGKG